MWLCLCSICLSFLCSPWVKNAPWILFLYTNSFFTLISSKSSSTSCHISHNTYYFPSNPPNVLAYFFLSYWILSATALSLPVSSHTSSSPLPHYSPFFLYPSSLPHYLSTATILTLSLWAETWFISCSYNPAFSDSSPGSSLSHTMASFLDLSFCLVYAALMSISSNSKGQLSSSLSPPKCSSHLLVTIPTSLSLSST